MIRASTPKTVVADASAVVDYLLRTERADAIGSALQAGEADVHVPALCDMEVCSALRRGLLSGQLSRKRADQALEDYLDLPLSRHGHQPLLRRILALHQFISAYDAAYVALAERLGAPLLTGDRHLARACERIGVNTLPV